MLNESHWSPLPISFKHIDSTPGWKTFDITPIVIKWRQGLVNHGLQLRLTKGKETLSCEGVFSEGEEDPLNTEPLLIVYANDHNILTTSLKRDITPQQQKRTPSPVDEEYDCHRKQMMIKADSLKSSGKILMDPQSFDIGVCEGQCLSSLQHNPDHPYEIHYGNPVYARLFDLHHHNTKGSSIPSRCCVPSSFKKTALLYYDETSRNHFLRHAEIVVEKCACL